MGRAEEIENMAYVDSKGREKEIGVNFVGRYEVEQRQRRLEGFVEMTLGETNLSTRYGDDDPWEGDWSLPNLKSLWLEKTLIQSWSDLVAICELCPQLQWISLLRTRIPPPPENTVNGVPLPAPIGAPTMSAYQPLVVAPFRSKVTTLVLNFTMVTWKDVLALDAAGVFPCLEHLHLAHNRLSEGVPDLIEFAKQHQLQRQPLSCLKNLVLDANGISDWSVISRAIRSFPTLEVLHLNENYWVKTSKGLLNLAPTKRRASSHNYV